MSLDIPAAWTEERVKRCYQLYIVEGHSAARTAAILGGGVSRNAVVGIGHRRGWSRGTDAMLATARQQTAVNRAPAKVRPSPPNPVGQIADVVKRAKANCEPSCIPFIDKTLRDGEKGTVQLVELRDGRTCKFPIGDPKADDFGFCGARPDGEGPYCSRHASVCFKPEEKKGPKSASELIRSCRRYA